MDNFFLTSKKKSFPKVPKKQAFWEKCLFFRQHPWTKPGRERTSLSRTGTRLYKRTVLFQLTGLKKPETDPSQDKFVLPCPGFVRAWTKRGIFRIMQFTLPEKCLEHGLIGVQVVRSVEQVAEKAYIAYFACQRLQQELEAPVHAAACLATALDRADRGFQFLFTRNDHAPAPLSPCTIPCP